MEQSEQKHQTVEEYIKGLQGRMEGIDEEQKDDKPDEQTATDEAGSDKPAEPGEVKPEEKADVQKEPGNGEPDDKPAEVTGDDKKDIQEDKPKEVEITPEKEIEIFNKLTGLQVDSVNKVREYSEILGKWPEYKKNIELYPTLIEKLKASQDIMSYFPDEQTYKAVQLSKDEKFKGKKAELTKVFESDVSALPNMDIVKLYAGINAPEGVKNPIRYTIKKMGLDPDEVIDSFDELSEDDKDLFNGFAFQARKELSEIGKDIEVPKSTQEDIEEILKTQVDSAKDDLEKRKNEITPIASAIVDEVKEFKVDDNFSFKLDLSSDDKKGYSDFLTQAILSGDYDVSTDEGKQDLYNALMDEIWVDNRNNILKAHATFLRSSIEKEWREKNDNDAPLDKKTPPPDDKQPDKSEMVRVIESMIGEMK
jgi:hypothetical protein